MRILGNPAWRDTFEKYGEEVIRQIVAAGHSPTAEKLQPIYQDKHFKSGALSWLTERGDKKANQRRRVSIYLADNDPVSVHCLA